MTIEPTPIDPLWHLADTLSATNASALIAGYEPTTVRFDESGPSYFENEHGHADRTNITRVKVAFKAIVGAILGGYIPAKVIHASRAVEADDSIELFELMEIGDIFAPNNLKELATSRGETLSSCGNFFLKQTPDWDQTLLETEDIKSWLRSKGVTTGFFFPSKTNTQEYLDPEHPRYAPKLAALVNAWLAYTPIPGKTAKQVLTRWLNEHASEFGLTDDDGNPLAGLNELASSANWDTKGGAPKTLSTK
ncbi:hypothetical protein NUT31_01685 [Aeromonas sp. BC14]|nr:hypothetical protein [Aeromonas sp. BC14]WAF95196.1 hypothetical protein NUT31_01685 [Aeromonas sp. BC14]